MPANTTRGLPYPLPTEPVAEGAQAIRNLAEALDVTIFDRRFVFASAYAGSAFRADAAELIPVFGPPVLGVPATAFLLVSALFGFGGELNGTITWESSLPIEQPGSAGDRVPAHSGVWTSITKLGRILDVAATDQVAARVRYNGSASAWSQAVAVILVLAKD